MEAANGWIGMGAILRGEGLAAAGVAKAGGLHLPGCL